MLSRTAESLYWLARYVERAENIARILHAGQRMATVTRSIGSTGDEWESTLAAAGCLPAYRERHEKLSGECVTEFLISDPVNPSCIVGCLEAARRNARAARTALTVDMWETLNEMWLELRSFGPQLGSGPEGVPAFLVWVKQRALQFQGAYVSSMLRNDAFSFTQLGTYLERADSTARILAVKHQVLLSREDEANGPLDYVQRESILLAVSALRAYRWVYRERLTPRMIAELLILRPELPRSLVACLGEVAHHLELLADAYGGRRGECHRRAGEIHARLRYGRIADIFASGLHEFLTRFIEDDTRLGQDIGEFYLLG